MAFRIKNWNGRYWNPDNKHQKEIKRAKELIEIRVRELRQKTIDDLVELDYCELCAKKEALNVIMNHYAGKSFDFKGADVRMVTIIRVDIEQMSGKCADSIG